MSRPWVYAVALLALLLFGAWGIRACTNVGIAEFKAETATNEAAVVKQVVKKVQEKRTEVIKDAQDTRSAVDKLNADSVANELREDWSRSSH